MRKKLSLERLLMLMSTVFLCTAFVASITATTPKTTIIPYYKTVIPAVHAICILVSAFLIFCPEQIVLVSALAITESSLTILIGYEQLGIFIFYAIVIYLFTNGYLVFQTKLKLSLLATVHILSLIGTYRRGLPQMALSIATSAFFCTFYIIIYKKLHHQLSYLCPTKIAKNDRITQKEGTTLHLSEFDLTGRQINLTLDYIYENLNYNQLAEKYIISLSTVKNDFRRIFKVFNVTKLEELHILLIRYKIER